MFGCLVKKKKEEISHSLPGIQYKVVKFKELSRISRESVISEFNRIKKWSKKKKKKVKGMFIVEGALS